MNIASNDSNQHGSPDSRPSVWAVTLGFNNAEDTVACLKSLAASVGVELHLVFTDNASKDDSVARVLAECPAVHVLQTGANLGFARGFNVGMNYCLQQGADYVLMINNDTVVAPDCVRKLLDAALQQPRAGLCAPKIFYFDHPRVIWSAGSRFRRFPPAVIMRKTADDDDGRYDSNTELEFVTTCALLASRRFLERVGLLDRDYFILYDDYDWSLRAREAGFDLRLVPQAHLWHKVSKSTGVGTRSPFFWTHYGRSTALFFRKHRHNRWLTSPIHLAYLLARILVEGKYFGLLPFMKGWREGGAAPLQKPPLPGSAAVESCAVVRGR